MTKGKTRALIGQKCPIQMGPSADVVVPANAFNRPYLCNDERCVLRPWRWRIR